MTPRCFLAIEDRAAAGRGEIFSKLKSRHCVPSSLVETSGIPQIPLDEGPYAIVPSIMQLNHFSILCKLRQIHVIAYFFPRS